MDRLPQELIIHIASFLEREGEVSPLRRLQGEKGLPKLPPYATLSREWQLAIESRAFRFLRLKSSELPYLTQVSSRYARHRLLSHLAYDVLLPTYKDSECAKFETREDMERNSQALTYAMHALFQFLKTWEAGGTEQESPSLSLDLSDIYSPMDGLYRGSDKYEEDMELYESGKRYDLWGHRYEHSLLQLLEHPKLPSLSCVSHFSIETISRHLEPKSAVQMAAKLSNVQSVDLDLSDNEKKHPLIRQQLRHGIVNIRFSLLPGSLAVKEC